MVNSHLVLSYLGLACVLLPRHVSPVSDFEFRYFYFVFIANCHSFYILTMSEFLDIGIPYRILQRPLVKNNPQKVSLFRLNPNFFQTQILLDMFKIPRDNNCSKKDGNFNTVTWRVGAIYTTTLSSIRKMLDIQQVQEMKYYLGVWLPDSAT